MEISSLLKNLMYGNHIEAELLLGKLEKYFLSNSKHKEAFILHRTNVSEQTSSLHSPDFL